MIHPRLVPLSFAILMSLYMVTCMTFVITWVNTGLDGEFYMRWARAFVIAYPIAFALILAGAPRIRKFVEGLARQAAH